MGDGDRQGRQCGPESRAGAGPVPGRRQEGRARGPLQLDQRGRRRNKSKKGSRCHGYLLLTLMPPWHLRAHLFLSYHLT